MQAYHTLNLDSDQPLLSSSTILSEKELRIKTHGLEILFEIADCTAGLKTGRQHDFLSELSTLELAIMGTVVRALGSAYGEMCFKLDPGAKRERMCIFEDKYVTSNVVIIYRKISKPLLTFLRLIRYGPFFALAAFGGEGITQLEADWVYATIERGLIDLDTYETGGLNAKPLAPSLQSRLWDLFCLKMKCTYQNRLDIAMELIEISLRS